MTVSEYIWNYLADKGVTHVYYLPGGGCSVLLDYLGRNDRLTPVVMLHEQQCAIASIGHNILTNTLSSVVLCTTGPGGTNTLTGVVAAWIDECPLMVISGQVPTHMMMKEPYVDFDRDIVRPIERQKGPQEVQIIEIVQPIIKMAFIVHKFHHGNIMAAYNEAITYPRGPVWLDIPLDIQGANI